VALLLGLAVAIEKGFDGNGQLLNCNKAFNPSVRARRGSARALHLAKTPARQLC
jgi:hypothetical protein